MQVGSPQGGGTGCCSGDPQWDSTPVSLTAASRLSSASGAKHLLLHPSPGCSQAGALSWIPLPRRRDGNPLCSPAQLQRAWGGEIRQDLLLALKDLQLPREQANPDKREVSLAGGGGCQQRASGQRGALQRCRRGLMGFPALRPADPIQASGRPAGEPGCSDSPVPRPGAEGQRFLFRHLHFSQRCSSQSW